MNVKSEAIILNLRTRSWHWFIPLFGILVYWRSKYAFFKENGVIIPRTGQPFIDPQNMYESLEGGSHQGDFWVLKEYAIVFRFYRKAFLYSLFLPFLFVMVICILINFQPFLDVALWSYAAKKLANTKKLGTPR